MSDYLDVWLKNLTWKYWAWLIAFALIVTALLEDPRVVWWNRALILAFALHLTYAFGRMLGIGAAVRGAYANRSGTNDSEPDDTVVCPECGHAFYIEEGEP